MFPEAVCFASLDSWLAGKAVGWSWGSGTAWGYTKGRLLGWQGMVGFDTVGSRIRFESASGDSGTTGVFLVPQPVIH